MFETLLDETPVHPEADLALLDWDPDLPPDPEFELGAGPWSADAGFGPAPWPGPAEWARASGSEVPDGPPSGLLMDALAALTPHRLDDEAALDAAAGWERLISYASGRQLRALARFAALRPGTGGRTFSEFAPDELALELQLTVGTAGNRLALAVDLTGRLPGTLAALERGDIDLLRARVIADATRVLSDAHARQVEQRVLARAPGQNATQLRAATRRAVVAVDPDGAQQRHERSVAGRQVNSRPLEDGMAELGITAAAPDVAAAYAHVDRLARAARTPGDERTLDQLRTDVALDLLTGRTHPAPAGPGDAPGGYGRAAADVQVTVPITTLLGMDESPADLAGYGPIPAGLARQIAADGVWRRLLTDPASGALLDYGRTTYRPPAALAGHVRARDTTCIFPGCRRPACRCDLDHTIAHEAGGPTADHNLGPLCRHHHRCKQHPGWALAQPRPGTFTWTTPTGRQHTRHPEPLIEPAAEPAAGPAAGPAAEGGAEHGERGTDHGIDLGADQHDEEGAGIDDCPF